MSDMNMVQGYSMVEEISEIMNVHLNVASRHEIVTWKRHQITITERGYCVGNMFLECT